jgi:hypothetical protein
MFMTGTRNADESGGHGKFLAYRLDANSASWFVMLLCLIAPWMVSRSQLFGPSDWQEYAGTCSEVKTSKQAVLLRMPPHWTGTWKQKTRARSTLAFCFFDMQGVELKAGRKHLEGDGKPDHLGGLLIRWPPLCRWRLGGGTKACRKPQAPGATDRQGDPGRCLWRPVCRRGLPGFMAVLALSLIAIYPAHLSMPCGFWRAGASSWPWQYMNKYPGPSSGQS